MTTRSETRTERVHTEFGNLYLHADHNGSRVVRIWTSAPQKLEETQVGKLIEEIMHGMNRLIKPVSEIDDAERIAQVREIIATYGVK